MHDVYILRCADGSLYIGHTDDLAMRVARHNAGSADCSFTRKRRPVRLVYSEPFASREAAVSRERQLKRWTRAKKDALISGDTPLLKRL
jgi:predicted GIY-YIG superfamily endonuclease